MTSQNEYRNHVQTGAACGWQQGLQQQLPTATAPWSALQHPLLRCSQLRARALKIRVRRWSTSPKSLGKMPENGAVVLARKERAQQFNVDVPSEVIWPKWEVGGDFKQTLIIKNVGKECIVLTYKLPATKLFFMNFPETKRLSPGLAMSVEVSFRPTKREYCEQLLEFTWNKSKSFFIKLRATLPEQVIRRNHVCAGIIFLSP